MRGIEENLEEYQVANKYFDVYANRTEIPFDSLVIGRYSVLPYYDELEKDLFFRNSTLINSYKEHLFIANFHYYEYISDLTPQTWFEYEFYKCEYNGPFVVKGLTNSRKHQWNTHMFAKNKIEALHIASKLANDPLIGQQGIIYRKYISGRCLYILPEPCFHG